MLVLAFLTASVIQIPDVKVRQPQLAANGNSVALAFGAGNDVWFAASSDTGKSFAAPVKVGSAGVLSLGMRRGPRLALAEGAVLITAVAGEKGKGADGDIVLWRSADGGRTWGASKILNSAPGSAREGLHGMAARGKTVFVTWLDLRGKGTALYGKASRDSGATWSKDFLVYRSPDGHICECCHPSAAVGPKGELYAMWRNWLGGSRDLWIGESEDAGATWQTAKSGAGTWPLNACPMDGGAVVSSAQGSTMAVWRRDKTVYVAEGAEESVIGPGKDPSLALGSKGSYVAWVNEGKVWLKRHGVAPEELGEGAAPSLAGGNSIVAAWEDNGVIKTKRID